jgi:hypothetical protein
VVPLLQLVNLRKRLPVAEQRSDQRDALPVFQSIAFTASRAAKPVASALLNGRNSNFHVLSVCPVRWQPRRTGGG